MKLAFFLIALVFIAFAYLQFNDPDPYLWVTFYGLVALLSALRVVGFYSKRSIILTMAALGMFSLSLLPHVLDWLQSDHPGELFGEMIYSKPHIEGTREFLGLMIAEIALVAQLIWPQRNVA